MTATLLDALGCPYCGSLLFKESHVVRCERDHRFESSVVRTTTAGGATTASNGAGGVSAVQLRVVWHSDRREVGRVWTFALEI